MRAPDDPSDAPRAPRAPRRDPPLGTAALSLVELRRHLIRRAGTLHVRARALKVRGDIYSAARLEEQASRLREIARDMGGDDMGGADQG